MGPSPSLEEIRPCLLSVPQTGLPPSLPCSCHRHPLRDPCLSSRMGGCHPISASLPIHRHSVPQEYKLRAGFLHFRTSNELSLITSETVHSAERWSIPLGGVLGGNAGSPVSPLLCVRGPSRNGLTSLKPSTAPRTLGKPGVCRKPAERW